MAIRNDKLGGSDFTNGEVLYDYDLDDTNNAVIRQNIKNAELAVRTLQANNVFTNGPNLLTDDFTDNDGVNNTVNVGNTTAKYWTDSNDYKLNGISISNDTTENTAVSESVTYNNPSNCFDNDLNTSATQSGNRSSSTYSTRIGKTFSSARTINTIFYKWYGSDSQGANNTWTVKLQTYNGSTWNDVTTLYNSNDSPGLLEGNYSLNSSVQGVAIIYTQVAVDTSNTVIDAFNLQAGSYNTSDTVFIDSNTTSLDGNEKGFAVSVPDSTFPTNTSIDITIGDGSNTLTTTTVDSTSKGVVIGNGSAFGGPLSSGTLEVTFTLKTTDDTVTPTLKNYGVDILR